MMLSLWVSLNGIKDSRIFIYSLLNMKMNAESANADFKAGEEFLETR